MKGFPDLPPIWMAGFGAAQWLLGYATPVSSDPAVRWLGGLTVLLGLVLVFWAARQFMRHKTPIEPHHEPKTLIETGPFKFTRNPIYVAMVVILVGWTLWIGVVVGLLLVPLFRWIINVRFVQIEEAALRRQFGPAADAYIDRTQRWVLR